MELQLKLTAKEAYNKTGKSDSEARVGRARRGFVLGYKVHAACCTGSELPLAFTVAPCNMNEKLFKLLFQERKREQAHFLQPILKQMERNTGH